MSFFSSVPLVKISHAPGEWVLGSWKEGERTETPFNGSWQPAGGQTLQVLPEGKRNRQAYKVICPIDIEFSAADEKSGISGDRILHNGKEYEVSSAAKWDNGLLPHWVLICTRLPPASHKERAP